MDTNEFPASAHRRRIIEDLQFAQDRSLHGRVRLSRLTATTSMPLPRAIEAAGRTREKAKVAFGGLDGSHLAVHPRTPMGPLHGGSAVRHRSPVVASGLWMHVSPPRLVEHGWIALRAVI